MTDVDLFGNPTKYMASKLSKDDREKEWKWSGMPEFHQTKQEPYAKIIFRFEDEGSLQEFGNMIGQALTAKTKSSWHPFKPHKSTSTFEWEEID